MQRNSGNRQGLRGTRRSGRTIVLGGGGRRSSLQPPPFQPTVGLSHKFRFTNGANTSNFSVSRANLLNLLLVGTSATATVRLIEAIRLKFVEVWSNPVALGAAPASCQIEWLGENSPSTVISDAGMGVRPAHVASAPPSSSSNRWWSVSGSLESDVLFILGLPVNSVVDVTVDLRFVESETPTAGDIPAGASLGQVYGDYLDGLASGKLAPVGFNALP